MSPSNPHMKVVSSLPSINKNTPISVGLAALLLGAVAGLAVSYGKSAQSGSDTTEQVADLKTKVEAIEREHAVRNEQTQKDIADVRGDIRVLNVQQQVLNKNMELLLGRWGVQPARAAAPP